MDVSKGFIEKNWYHIIMFLALLSGAVYQFGFVARDYAALNERLNAMEKVRDERGILLQQMQKEIDRLQWSSDDQKSSVNNIGTDVRGIDSRTRIIEQQLAVILELLKPRKLGAQ